MNKLVLSLLSLAAASVIACAKEVPMYDANYTASTKEVVMFSQLLKKQQSPFPISMTGYEYGNRGFFGLLSKNTDTAWKGKVNLYLKIDHCVSEEEVLKLEKEGFIIKSRIADATVVAYRESIRRLKENGAKYIFIGREGATQYKGESKKYYYNKEGKYVIVASDDEVRNSVMSGMPFADYFQTVLTDKSFVNSTDRGYVPNAVSFSRTWDDGCFQKSQGNGSGLLWFAGQVASLALGAAGAHAGNVDMTSLAANSSQAVNYATKDGTSNFPHADKISGVPRTLHTSISGYVDPSSIDKNEANMKIEGYLFPIEEVEEHLSHYMTIPYKVGKIEKD